MPTEKLHKSCLFLATALVATLCQAAHATAPAPINTLPILNTSIYDIGSPGSSSGNITSAMCINGTGQITGSTRGFSSDPGDRGFVWTPAAAGGTTGSFADLGNINHQPYGGESHGQCINNSGTVSGYFSENPAGAPYDAFRDSNGQIDIITYFGGAQITPAIYGVAINDSGAIAGWSENKYQSGSSWLPFWCAYRSVTGTSKTILSPLSGGGHDNSYAYAENNIGQIVGKSMTSTGAYRATLWQPGSTTPIDLGLGDNSQATSINSNGDIVGVAQGNMFIWRPAAPNGTSGTAVNAGQVVGYTPNPIHVNDSDQIVGYFTYTSSGTSTNYAFYYDTLGYEAIAKNGVYMNQANWINNSGQIVGQYNVSSTPTSSGFVTLPVAKNVATLNLWDAADSWSTKLFFSDGNIANGITGPLVATQEAKTPFKGVVGSVADGASRILLEFNSTSSLPVTFSSSLPGAIKTIQGCPFARGNGMYTTYAVYCVPDVSAVFASTQTQNATTLTAMTNSVATSMPLTLGRPPVVLVHGLWDNPSLWDKPSFFEGSNGVKPSLTSAGLTTFQLDYRSTNHSSLLTNSYVLLTNTGSIKTAIDQYHSRGWAATKVDIIGHSMGGIVARYFASRPAYLAVDNYYQGYIHRLITIGSPHKGSPEAQIYYWAYLTYLQNHSTSAWLFLLLANNGFPLVLGPHPPGLAVRDLSPMSAALQSISVPSCGLPVYAEAGQSGNAVNGLFAVADLAVQEMVGSGAGHLFCTPSVTDGVVSVPSQEGGLPPGWITLTSNIRHSWEVPVLESTEVGCAAIGTDIVNQLMTDNFAPGSFPGVTTDSGNCLNLTTPPDPFPANAIDPSGLSFPPSATIPSGPGPMAQSSLPAIQLSSPTAGENFAPGDTVTISPSSNNSFVISAAAMTAYAADGSLIGSATMSGPPFNCSFTIPTTIVGPVTVNYGVWDSSGNAYFGTVQIQVQPTANVQTISVLPTSMTFTGTGQTQSLEVFGAFADGVQRDISSFNTVYSSSNTSVATVDANGVVTSVGNGTATITVGNGNYVVSIPATVTVAAPEVLAVEPASILHGQAQVFNLRLDGVNFGGVTSVTFLTASGTADPNVTVSGVSLSPNGCTLTATVSVSANCPIETDSVVVTAAGGSSDPQQTTATFSVM